MNENGYWNYTDEITTKEIAIDTLLKQNKKLQAKLDMVKEYCIKQKKHCLKEKEKDYIDDLGKEQLLGSYITCELILSKLEEVVR